MIETNRIGGNGNSTAPVRQENVKDLLRRSGSTAGFETILQEQLKKNEAEQSGGLQFSKHARDRVEQRGIELTEGLLGSLNDAVEKVRAKGAKEVVIIDARQAFIVHVPSNTVITAISEPEMKDSVFTNIDSAVII